MQISTSITTDDYASIPARAAELEAAGFDALSTQDGRHEPFIPLALAATTTDRVGLATNVAIAFPRSPMVAATTAWDLQALSNGRFTLGLGSQVRAHIQKRYSTEWRKPAAKMREYVESIQAIHRCWADGERLLYEGDHYNFSLMTPNFTPPPLDTPPPRIEVAAVGPMMLQVAGETADGVTLHPFSTRAYIEDVTLPRLQAAWAAAGRTRQEFSIAGGGFIATGPDAEAAAAAAEWARKRVGFYGSTPSYWPVFEHHGLDGLGPELNALSKAGEWDEMTRRIDDDVLDLFCATAAWDGIAAAVADRFGGVSDQVSVESHTPASVIAELKTV